MELQEVYNAITTFLQNQNVVLDIAFARPRLKQIDPNGEIVSELYLDQAEWLKRDNNVLNE